MKTPPIVLDIKMKQGENEKIKDKSHSGTVVKFPDITVMILGNPIHILNRFLVELAFIAVPSSFLAVAFLITFFCSISTGKCGGTCRRQVGREGSTVILGMMGFPPCLGFLTLSSIPCISAENQLA